MKKDKQFPEGFYGVAQPVPISLRGHGMRMARV